LNVHRLTPNKQREAGSPSTQPLAAWQLIVAALWQSLRTAGVKTIHSNLQRWHFGIPTFLHVLYFYK